MICHGGNIMAVMSELTGEDYYGFYVGNLDGYVMKADVDGKRISVVSYDRIGSGTDT